MAELPARWYQLTPPGAGYIELQVYWNCGAPVPVSPAPAPNLRLVSLRNRALAEPEPEPEPEPEEDPAASFLPMVAADEVDAVPDSAQKLAADQLAVARLGRDASNGQWCGVQGAMMSDLLTVEDCEWREDCDMSIVRLSSPHGGRVGDAVGVSADCVKPPLVEPRWVESGFLADFNLHQDFFNCYGDASEVMPVGTEVIIEGENHTIKAITLNTDSGDCWVQLDRHHQLSQGSPLLVCEPVVEPEPLPSGGEESLPSGFQVSGNAHQSWFHVKGDATTMMFSGQHLRVGPGPDAALFMIEAINYIGSKLETFIQLDRLHVGHLQLGDEIYLAVQNLDRRFVHSGSFIENVDVANDRVIRVAQDMRLIMAPGSQIQIASLPAHGSINLARTKQPDVKEILGELVFSYT